MTSDALVQRLFCHTLRQHPRGQAVARILAAALQAVEPGAAVRRYLRHEQDTLWVGERAYSLADVARIHLVGFGKAAVPMGQAAVEVLGHHLQRGLLITKEGHTEPPAGGLSPRLTVLEAGHPIPDERSLHASRHMADFLASVGTNDLVLCLISGGGSALLTAPAPGVSLADLQALTGWLLASGASINEINTLRKHLEVFKGGGLARAAAPAGVAALALSDVIGDPLDVIASGPTVPDPTTYQDALDILARYGLRVKAPAAILEYLLRGAQGAIPETPKPGEALFEHVHTLIVGSNRQAAQAALRQSEVEGFSGRLLTTSLQGEARQAGRFIAALGRELASGSEPVPLPACLVLGGETTVTLTGSGLGGRNQELALGAVADLAGLENILLVTLATDGGDGPTDAAGAVVSGDSLQRALTLGLNPQQSLAHNDAYHFFQALDDLLKPGPTQTNVNDLTLVFAF
jgi:glycerate 2-kinase